MKSLESALKKYAQETPNAEALIGSNINVSYRSLATMVDAVAKEIQALGVCRLGIYGSNTIDWVVMDLAAAVMNIPVIPVPLFFSDSQRDHLLADSGVDTLFCVGDLPGVGCPLADSELLSGHYRKIADVIPSAKVAFSKVTYTSGSTGTPKGACLSGDTLMTIASSLAQALEPSALGRHLCLLPFATLLENVAGIYLPLYMGRSLVIDDNERFGLLSNHSFDVVQFLAAVERHQAESVILLPQMLKALVESDDIERVRSLRFIAVGGGKVPSELLERALALGLPVFEGYGLTECGSCVALNTPVANRVGSVGKPLAHARLRISDAGEVVVMGAAMTGYLGDSEEIREIATGDAGFVDEDGFLYITGRIKNTIISSFGRNISPEWVESQFLADPSIAQIAVFGEGCPALTAVIFPNPQVDETTLARIIERINNSLPDYARIVGWHRAMTPFCADEGTLTTNGKLCRSGVARRYQKPLKQLAQITSGSPKNEGRAA